jgi:hypothetical protein
MIDATLVSFVSALTALVASIAGPIITLYVARSQVKAAVRSANRQRWIDEFRDLINYPARVASSAARCLTDRSVARCKNLISTARAAYADKFYGSRISRFCRIAGFL